MGKVEVCVCVCFGEGKTGCEEKEDGRQCGKSMCLKTRDESPKDPEKVRSETRKSRS